MTDATQVARECEHGHLARQCEACDARAEGYAHGVRASAAIVGGHAEANSHDINNTDQYAALVLAESAIRALLPGGEK